MVTARAASAVETHTESRAVDWMSAAVRFSREMRTVASCFGMLRRGCRPLLVPPSSRWTRRIAGVRPRQRPVVSNESGAAFRQGRSSYWPRRAGKDAAAHPLNKLHPTPAGQSLFLSGAGTQGVFCEGRAVKRGSLRISSTSDARVWVVPSREMARVSGNRWVSPLDKSRSPTDELVKSIQWFREIYGPEPTDKE